MNSTLPNKWLPENLNNSNTASDDHSKFSFRYHLSQPNQSFRSPKLAKINRDLTKLPDDSSLSFNNDNLTTMSRTLRGMGSNRDVNPKRREPYADIGKSIGTTGNITSPSSNGGESKPRTREYNKTLNFEEQPQPNNPREERKKTLLLDPNPQKSKTDDRNKSRGAIESYKTIDEPRRSVSKKPSQIQVKTTSITNLTTVRIVSPKANARPVKKISPLKSPSGDTLAQVVLHTGDDSEVIELDSPLNPPGKIKKTQINKSQTTTNLLKNCTKRYMLAQHVVKAFESTLESDNPTRKRSQNAAQDQSPKDDYDSFTEDPMQHTKLTLQNMLNSIQAAIQCRRDRKALNHHLDQMTEIAGRTYNAELQLAAMKTQGKIRLIYNDIYRAIMAFKQIKKTADQYKSYTNKLKAYKYLGICFHRVENYRQAIFYNIKMLQAAWLCNSKRYELLAYDNIGIEHYYQGDIEKATFYHEKMMAGHVEPANSKLRQLGINKLIIRMNEASQNSKKNNPGSLRPKKVQEELYEFEVPLSEDDFELPSPRNQRHVVQGESSDGDTLIPIKKIEKKKVNVGRDRTHHILKRMMEAHSKSTSSFRDVKSKANLTLETSETIKPIRRVVNETFNGPINPNILISHLSPNRLLNNFHPKDTKYIVSAYMARGTEAEDNYAILDAKSLEKIRKKLEKLKENTQLALKRIIQMQQVQNKLKSHTFLSNDSPLRKPKKAVFTVQKV